jgi:hypothetical protein
MLEGRRSRRREFDDFVMSVEGLGVEDSRRWAILEHAIDFDLRVVKDKARVLLDDQDPNMIVLGCDLVEILIRHDGPDLRLQRLSRKLESLTRRPGPSSVVVAAMGPAAMLSRDRIPYLESMLESTDAKIRGRSYELLAAELAEAEVESVSLSQSERVLQRLCFGLEQERDPSAKESLASGLRHVYDRSVLRGRAPWASKIIDAMNGVEKESLPSVKADRLAVVLAAEPDELLYALLVRELMDPMAHWRMVDIVSSIAPPLPADVISVATNALRTLEDGGWAERTAVPGRYPQSDERSRLLTAGLRRLKELEEFV